jgi:hypothetical protein
MIIVKTCSELDFKIGERLKEMFEKLREVTRMFYRE